MKCSGKIDKSYNYFSGALYLTSLTGFWILPSLNKYSLAWRVTSRWVFYETYSEPCLLPQIRTYLGIFTQYSDIFSYIMEYLEPYVTLAFSEPCHIQNPGILRTKIYSKLCEGIFWYIQNAVKPGLRFCAGSNPARDVSEICDGEDLWQRSQLEIRPNAFRRSTIPQKQFIINSGIFMHIQT